MREPHLNISEKKYVFRKNRVGITHSLKDQKEAFPQQKPKTINAVSQKWKDSEPESIDKKI
jgi:hypothetical protein